MSNLFLVIAVLGGALALMGMLGLMVVIAFDWGEGTWAIRGCAVGMVLGTLAGIGYCATRAPSPLSRGIVADKEHRSYTAMVMVGKVMVPQHFETWTLTSARGATCDVSPAEYDNFRSGDAVVCAWH